MNYGNRSCVVKLRVSNDQLARWTAAATARDARARKNGHRWDRGEGLSGLVRAAVEVALTADQARRRRARSRRVATPRATKKDPRRRRIAALAGAQRRVWRTLFAKRLASVNGGR
jgi:hypothetical protein